MAVREPIIKVYYKVRIILLEKFELAEFIAHLTIDVFIKKRKHWGFNLFLKEPLLEVIIKV